MSWRGSILLVALLIVFRLATGTRGDDWRSYRQTALVAEQTYAALVALEELQITQAGSDLSSLGAGQAALSRISEEEPAQRARLQALDRAIAAGRFEEARRLTTSAREAERGLLASRLAISETQAFRSQRSASVGGLVLLVLLAMATLVIEMDIRKRRRAEALVRDSEERLQRANESLETRVALRTAELAESNLQLESANKELEAFSYSVSHDLRAPLRSIHSFSQIVLDEYADKLDEEGAKYLRRVRAGAQNMGQLIDDLLNLSRLSRAPLRREVVSLSAIALKTLDDSRSRDPDRQVRVQVATGVQASCDARLLQVVLNNLLGNAWKFSSKREDARLEFGAMEQEGGMVYFVRDNGAGFDMAYAAQLFAPFQRLHNTSEFEGTGVGLATVQRIIHRHGGRIWAESSVGNGAVFYFTLTGDTKGPTETSCQTNSSSL